MSTLLIALTDDEKRDFIPSPVQEMLEALPFKIHWQRLPLQVGEDWLEILDGVKPDVLMAAWGCPPLPDDLKVGRDGGLRYVAYLAGSIKELVPRSLLERGLQVTNWGSSIGKTVAECGLLLILSAMRRASYWSVAMHRDGGWKQGLGTVTQSLFGRSIGIHGFGQIAQQMVPLLRPFGGEISALSPGVPDVIYEGLGVKRCHSLEELFANHDVIVELAPYTPENCRIITGELLRSIRPGGVFVNIGRGEVVDEEALIRVARDRPHDLQIALDVYAIEPLPVDSPLRGLPNVALLPHIAGPTTDRRKDSTAFAIENLSRFIQGEEISQNITTEIFDRTT